MRIRKGQRCLPLAPANSSLTFQHAHRWRNGAKGEAAMVAVGDMIGPQCRQRATEDTSMERKGSLEHDLEKNRAPVHDKIKEISWLMSRDTGVMPTLMKLADTPVNETQSPSTRNPPRCKIGTISGSTATATEETRDEPNSLEQSLRHVCAGAGMSGTSAHNAVAQIREQGLPSVSERGSGLTEQVMNSFRNSSKSFQGKEPGRYVIQVQTFPETKSVTVEESGISDAKKTVPSSESVEVAKQLQNLQSFSRGSGAGAWSEAQSDDRHGRKRKAAISESEWDGETGYNDEMAEKENSSVTYKSPKVMHINEDVSDLRCKRDDGRKWRCWRPAEAGYSMCTHHRKARASSQGKCGQNNGSQSYNPERSSPALRSPPVYVANSRVLQGVDTMGIDIIAAASSWSPFLDDELAHDEHRQFLKAKSMKSLLSRAARKSSHIRRGGI